MYIDIEKSLELINKQEFDLLKTFEINDTVSWGDLLWSLELKELLKLKHDRELIQELFKVAELIYTFKCAYGEFKIKARSGYIEKNATIGLRFIPKGILTYKLKNSVEEFAKNCGCEYEVCDSYIYLGIKRDRTVHADEENGKPREDEVKSNKESRRR